MNDDLHSAGDIAKAEGITVQAVYQAARRGEITAAITTRGGRKLFTAEAVERYIQMRAARKNGR